MVHQRMHIFILSSLLFPGKNGTSCTTTAVHTLSYFRQAILGLCASLFHHHVGWEDQPETKLKKNEPNAGRKRQTAKTGCIFDRREIVTPLSRVASTNSQSVLQGRRRKLLQAGQVQYFIFPPTHTKARRTRSKKMHTSHVRDIKHKNTEGPKPS